MPDIQVVDRRTIEHHILALLPYNMRAIGRIEGMACAVARIHNIEEVLGATLRNEPVLSKCGAEETLIPVVELYVEPDKNDSLYGFDVHLDPEADERWNDSARTVGDFAEIVTNLNTVLCDMSQHYFGATIAPDVYTLSGVERHQPLFPQEGLREAIENLRIRAIANPGLRKGIIGEYLDRPGVFEQYLRFLGSPLHRRGLNQKEQGYFSQLFGQEA